MSIHAFVNRHNGPDDAEVNMMLEQIGASSLTQLIDETIPRKIRLSEELNLPDALSEMEYLNELKKLSLKNKVFRSYIGMGYYNTFTPTVIQRNIFENPGWYTAYTPYQAEIAQGRLEALLNYQTMICDLTALPLANASLLDEGTAAAEAMNMVFNLRSKEQIKNGVAAFFVDDKLFPQSKDILITRAEPFGIKLIFGDITTHEFNQDFFGAILQYPDSEGSIQDHSALVASLNQKGIKLVVASDLLSLCLLSPPGEWGADIVVGNSQRFGVPMGYGGPHAAFMACKDEYKREMPGRIIGMSIDAAGNPALRMALQTREQHIKREKATSNICTAQVLLAVMAAMYAVYHGPTGLKYIANKIHRNARSLAAALQSYGYTLKHTLFFDTLYIQAGDKKNAIEKLALEKEINFCYHSNGDLQLSLDESISANDLNEIKEIFAKAAQREFQRTDDLTNGIEKSTLNRNSTYLSHPVFNTHHTETEMLRYLKMLENKDLALNHSMIPLGSCTMKLNATSEMIPLSWDAFSKMHPFAPANQCEGYRQMIEQLEKALAIITGFHSVSLQPNSGAQGEYAGLMVIRAYHAANGDHHRNIALIPSSAHGTNPASAVMAGMKVVVVKCDQNGNIDLEDLKQKCEQHKENLSCLMVTYPSTHGVYEEGIMDITAMVHASGGQVYMDGANMNAQVGLTNPHTIGADVCHLNLHKTFAIPHGGGGPGMGPIGVAEHLAPFLPSHPLVKTGGKQAIPAISAAPWGSASILLISYGYIQMLGKTGLRAATETAILNANYIASKLEAHYPILYKGKQSRVAHEMIIDCRAFKQSAGLEVADLAKRLMDYGFHAPTVSFPVAGTLMIEPTESENKAELDRFCEAMIAIREEIKNIETGVWSRNDNPLINAPHTLAELTADEWTHAYNRQQAAWPCHYLTQNKFWPSVKRVDNAYGDRNLVCSCNDISTYEHSDEVVGA
ncbi:MAG TPA: aminomethyl-transferring glycine dehydrogenase [Bacteroidia bacterium]|nr:aminomethyl-transferring glycine dehydrogenase [Bacteroidia bacterium]